ncbi:hypothetical protein QBC33DRAFT_582675 [Phialemonium atrogriseum]|uniref:FAD-binding FR-type domain-containing protein n=1 Tax=Phialemonium atrogriseum TaxID=1093897 RepID=A0AAJ0C936_9PEZI|nr:uncharacterized protein QBC33DRAFT_582675 [Phialemonium atrogriseum]KAK1772225.1 hypothetical protein QBC33DRAFT_582675 [Phialemonium atrogriseum]
MSIRLPLDQGLATTSGDPGRFLPDDPEKLAYLQRLIDAILNGRTIAATYNLVLLCALLVFAILHLRDTRRDRRRWKERTAEIAFSGEEGKDYDEQSYDNGGESSSSSSSTIRSAVIPLPSASEYSTETDLERVPLLCRQPKRTKAGYKIFRNIAAWLTYQPRPLPVVNRVLPSNRVSFLVAGFLGLNVFFHLYQVPLEPKNLFAFADRAGLIFVVNLPILYLLAAKNQPLKLMTGCSYEVLNIFHRRVGELLCFEAFVHLAGMIIWQLYLEPDWLRIQPFKEYLLEPIILLGLGAFAAYELLYFTSLGSFRQRWYELFLASHVVLQIVALVFLWLHFHTSRPYVTFSLVIFLVDRLVWRLSLKSMTTIADVTVLEDGETLMLSVDWDIPSPPSSSRLFATWQHNIRAGWSPTDHVFLTVPALGRTHTLQAHPFTIASAAPPIPSWTDASPPSQDAPPLHARLDLLIRTHKGFTADLLRHVHTHHPRETPLSVRLDGPYGSRTALDLLRASDTALLVAGGSGIAVTLPLASALLLPPPTGTSGRRRQRVRLLWVVHSRAHRAAWVPAGRLEGLVEAGLELVVPEPTAEAGRPDVAGLVRGWVADAGAEGDGVGVVVSGPDGMNREVANVCAEGIAGGVDLRVAVEKFGW